MWIHLALQLQLMLRNYLLLIQFWVPRAVSHCTLWSHDGVDTFIVVLIVRDGRKPDFFIKSDWEKVDAAVYRRTLLIRLLVILHHGVSADIFLGVVKDLLRRFIDRKHSKAARRALLPVQALLEVMLPDHLIETGGHHSQQSPIIIALKGPFKVVWWPTPDALLPLLMIIYDLFQREAWANLVPHHHQVGGVVL